MVPAQVTTCPGWMALSAVRRVRSSWRSGMKKSASSTVVRSFCQQLRALGPHALDVLQGCGAGRSERRRGPGLASLESLCYTGVRPRAS